jgi:hypothetical protein
MNLCKRGHDKDVTGTNTQGWCRVCKNENKRVHSKAHPRFRNNWPKLPYVKATTRAQLVPDGLEDEFGALPEPGKVSDWHDWVVVSRILQGISPGRTPYPSEIREVLRRNKIMSQQELARVSGVTEHTVVRWVARYA